MHATVIGLLVRVRYSIILTVFADGKKELEIEVPFSVRSDEEGRKAVVVFDLPPLNVGVRSVRLTVEDLFEIEKQGSEDALLATHAQKVDVSPLFAFDLAQHGSIQADDEIVQIFFSLRPSPSRSKDYRVIKF